MNTTCKGTKSPREWVQMSGFRTLLSTTLLGASFGDKNVVSVKSLTWSRFSPGLIIILVRDKKLFSPELNCDAVRSSPQAVHLGMISSFWQAA